MLCILGIASLAVFLTSLHLGSHNSCLPLLLGLNQGRIPGILLNEHFLCSGELSLNEILCPVLADHHLCIELKLTKARESPHPDSPHTKCPLIRIIGCWEEGPSTFFISKCSNHTVFIKFGCEALPGLEGSLQESDQCTSKVR